MILLDKFQDDAAPIPNSFESPSRQVTESPGVHKKIPLKYRI